MFHRFLQPAPKIELSAQRSLKVFCCKRKPFIPKDLCSGAKKVVCAILWASRSVWKPAQGEAPADSLEALRGQARLVDSAVTWNLNGFQDRSLRPLKCQESHEVSSDEFKARPVSDGSHEARCPQVSLPRNCECSETLAGPVHGFSFQPWVTAKIVGEGECDDSRDTCQECQTRWS